MKNIAIAVIGAGRIGKMHIENILRYFPQITIKTVADQKIDKDWIKKTGIENFTQNLQQVLDDQEIKAVVIATSTNTHAGLIKKAAEAGKDIFCEKPVAFTSSGIREVNAVVENNGVRLQVGYNRRFDPQFLEIKQCVSADKIGEPHIIRITNRDPVRPDLAFVPNSGGLFLDFNVHDFDMARFITGSEVVEVFAMGEVLVDPEIGKLGDIDTTLITMKMANRALCTIDSSRETNYGYDQRLEVFGSKGSVEAGNTKPLYTTLIDSSGIKLHHYHHSFIERYHDSYINQFESFFQSISEGKPLVVDGRDAYKAVAVAEAAKQSLIENRPVKVVY